MDIFERILGRPRAAEQNLVEHEVLGRMRELARSGRYQEAIDFALPHALRLKDLALHRELTHLRRDAANEAIGSSSPRLDWPPSVADPFPGCDTIPEIVASDLTTNLMQGAIQHHGSLLVRGAVERKEAVALATAVERAFVAHDSWVMGATCEDDDAWFTPFDLDPEDEIAKAREWSRQAGGIYAADSPAIFSRMVDLYRRRGLVKIIEEHLGERPLLSVGKTVIRRVEPTGPHDFHQDGSFLGRDIRTVNVWIALSDCGVDSPGLEIADRRLPLLETGTEGACFQWSVGREVARRANEGKPLARPIFRAGDALLFDQLMLHATSHDAAMNKPRYALEAWFFAPSTYKSGHTALLV